MRGKKDVCDRVSGDARNRAPTSKIPVKGKRASKRTSVLKRAGGKTVSAQDSPIIKHLERSSTKRAGVDQVAQGKERGKGTITLLRGPATNRGRKTLRVPQPKVTRSLGIVLVMRPSRAGEEKKDRQQTGGEE